MVKIAVLGAGINGLSCAVKIKEKYKNYQVTVISSDFSPNTTGDGSGGLWYPYLCGNTPNKQIIQWSGETLAYLQELWKTGAVSICLQPFYEFYTEKEHFTFPEWLNMTYGCQILNSKQLEFFNQRYSRKYTAGLTFVTLVVPPTKLLDYFQNRFKEDGGKILQGKISSPQDPILKEFDVIINCTGLGARFLVSDEKCAPIRGQIIRVNAPWLNETIMDISAGNYIIPNVETCVLGGTNQESYDTKPDPKDTEHILEGCKKLVPGLEHAKITKEWVGLRPGRDAIRLEPEEVNGKLFIHNYGHGGSGFTLFWGCSNEVLQILETYLHKNNTSHRASKL